MRSAEVRLTGATSVTGASVHHVKEGFPRLTPTQIFGDDAAGRAGAGRRGDMRRYGDLRMSPKGVVRGQGFLSENVQRCMADLTLVQRSKESHVIDERATASIEQDEASSRDSQALGVQEAFRVRGER